MFRPNLNDQQLLKAGRIAALTIGLIVMTLAVFFVNSKFGIFNLMVAFFTLFNIPVTVPIAFGLIFRRVPKWSAVGAITWGLIVGATTRYVLGWDIGPQVYLAFAMTFAIFATSRWTGNLYQTNKAALFLISGTIVVALGLLFSRALFESPLDLEPNVQLTLAYISALLLGLSLFPFARLFAMEKEQDKKLIEQFFKKIDTPVDVAKEVYAGGRRQVSTMPLVGRTIIFMGILVSMAYFTRLEQLEFIAVTAMVLILWGFGGTLWILGKRAEQKDARERAQVSSVT
jgi:hypothetical protein